MKNLERYRTKPTRIEIVEAIQLTGFGPPDKEIYFWIEQHVGSFEYRVLDDVRDIPDKGVCIGDNGFLLIATRNGVMQAQPGDWIIHDEDDNFRVCKRDIFATTYQQVEYRESQYNLPHSRACGIRMHKHGIECSTNCPTCGGKKYERKGYPNETKM